MDLDVCCLRKAVEFNHSLISELRQFVFMLCFVSLLYISISSYLPSQVFWSHHLPAICCCQLDRGAFQNTYELVNLGALKFSLINKLHIFQCMIKIFCMEFQREPSKFHTKYLTHTLKETIFIQYWKFRSSYIYEVVNIFETLPWACFLCMVEQRSQPLREDISCVRSCLVDFGAQVPFRYYTWLIHFILCCYGQNCNRLWHLGRT